MRENQEPRATWEVQEGAMVAPELDPEAVARELTQLNVVAEIDWYSSTPHLLGLNVLHNRSGGVAALDRADSLYRVGATVEEVVRHLAHVFRADVRIGSIQASEVDPGATFPRSADSSGVIRAVEVTGMPASSVPFLAASEGRSVGCLELEGGQRAVFYEVPADDFVVGVTMAAAPTVGFYVSDTESQLVAVTEPGEAAPESLAIHSWQMRTRVVAGAVDLDTPGVSARVRADLGHLENPHKVAALVEGANAEALAQAFVLEGRQGVIRAFDALGVPTDLASFLYGHLELEDVAGASVYHRPGWGSAFGSHVDIRLASAQEPRGFMSLYRKTFLDNPWLGRSINLAEAAVGGALTVVCARAGRSRSAWHKVVGTLGAILLADSAVQMVTASYLAQRLRRYRDRIVGDADAA